MRVLSLVADRHVRDDQGRRDRGDHDGDEERDAHRVVRRRLRRVVQTVGGRCHAQGRRRRRRRRGRGVQEDVVPGRVGVRRVAASRDQAGGGGGGGGRPQVGRAGDGQAQRRRRRRRQQAQQASVAQTHTDRRATAKEEHGVPAAQARAVRPPGRRLVVGQRRLLQQRDDGPERAQRLRVAHRRPVRPGRVRVQRRLRRGSARQRGRGRPAEGRRRPERVAQEQDRVVLRQAQGQGIFYSNILLTRRKSLLFSLVSFTQNLYVLSTFTL